MVPGVSSSELQRQNLPAYVGVDLSGDKRKGNSIVAVGLRYPDLRRVILKVRYGAWSSPETAVAVGEVCQDLNVQYIMVENNGYQSALIDWIRESKIDFPWWMKIEPFTTGSAKHHAVYGLPGFEVEDSRTRRRSSRCRSGRVTRPSAVIDWCLPPRTTSRTTRPAPARTASWRPGSPARRSTGGRPSSSAPLVAAAT